MTWTNDDMNLQQGKTVVITGAQKEHGYDLSLLFAEKGATVILGVSDVFKGRNIKDKIQAIHPEASIDVMYLDLNDLSSIRIFANDFKSKYQTLSILILNENIQSPQLRKTKEGFESQFGVNFLGHFALTGLLLDTLKRTPNSRVITIGKKLPKKTKLSFGHFRGTKNYNSEKFYTQSKLANMLFAKHLDEKFKQYNIQSLSICCQPPVFSKSEDSKKPKIRLTKEKAQEEGKVQDQSQNQNNYAWPILYAATNSNLTGGEYIGVGKSKPESLVESSNFNNLYDETVAHNLWQVSEKLCGVTYQF